MNKDIQMYQNLDMIHNDQKRQFGQLEEFFFSDLQDIWHIDAIG